MASSGYIADTFVAGEQPTTAKWNELWSNDASFNNGNGFNDGIIVNRHLASAAVGSSNIDFTTWNWYVQRAGTVNTVAPGSYAFAALNGGLTLTFPGIVGATYEVTISSTFVSSNATSQYDIAAQITGIAGTALDLIVTGGTVNSGIPLMGRMPVTPTSAGTITVTCGVISGSSATIRTDNYMVTARRIA